MTNLTSEGPSDDFRFSAGPCGAPWVVWLSQATHPRVCKTGAPIPPATH